MARLGDYGLSKLVTHSRGSLSMGRGTPYYMAPEMLAGRMDPGGASHAVPQPRVQYDELCDVYSFGMIMYEAQELCEPWSRENLIERQKDCGPLILELALDHEARNQIWQNTLPA